MKTFKLIDYKGKTDYAQDKEYPPHYMDFVVGEISKEDLIKEIPQRVKIAQYYGISAYHGNDEDILKIIDQKEREGNFEEFLEIHPVGQNLVQSICNLSKE